MRGVFCAVFSFFHVSIYKKGICIYIFINNFEKSMEIVDGTLYNNIVRTNKTKIREEF